MKKVAKLVLLALALGLFLIALSGCGNDNRPTLKVYNWGDYIDESVIKDFEKKYGIKVVYDNFATNEDMYVKLKSGGGDYDVVVPSDYMIKKMIKENMLQKIDLKDVPNYKYIDDQFRNLSYDPNNEYSIPYMWGTVGIIYNKTMVKEPVDSWKMLWNPKYSKQILMVDSQRDAIGITLKMLGYSLNTKNEKELEEAKKKLIEQKPLVLAYVVDEVKDKMIAGEAALAVVWSGDGSFMRKQNKDLDYVIPKEGSNLWFDAMVIPKTSKHKKEAELFINFLCDPEISYKNALYIGYATPISAAKEKLPAEVKNDKEAYPSPKELKKCEVFDDLASALPKYDKIWTEIKAAQ